MPTNDDKEPELRCEACDGPLDSDDPDESQCAKCLAEVAASRAEALREWERDKRWGNKIKRA